MIKAIDYLVTFVKWIGAFAIAMMMFLTCADVIMRAAGRPIFGAVEIVGFLATTALACSMPYTHVARGHVGVDLLVRKLPLKWQLVVDSLTGLLSAGLFAIVAWRCYLYGQTLKNSGEVSMTLEFPAYYFVYLIGLAFAVLTLNLLVDLVNNVKKVVGK